MRRKQILIFGISKYAELVAHYINNDTDHKVIGYVVDDEYYQDKEKFGKPVFKLSEAFLNMPSSKFSFFCAVGYKSIRNRKNAFEKLKQAGYSFISIVSKNAFCDSTATIGNNSIIMPNCVIEKNVTIGDNTVVWSNSTICHDTHINSHCFIAANSTVGGNVRIQEMSFLGFSSTVLQNTNCANETLLGAMSLLTHDSEEFTQYTGVPATKSGQHLKDGICIS